MGPKKTHQESAPPSFLSHEPRHFSVFVSSNAMAAAATRRLQRIPSILVLTLDRSLVRQHSQPPRFSTICLIKRR
jgi:hypothetical protein